ncbi:hypothetical protein FHX74_000829 [Friedmanniella endophytica]|uniref:Uncharacterized protein n=1 Tax=Microlunatus kandeliicorticis TaxID=1759536 RepID=A0A7W3IQB6_9ACTN|nr:DUF6350 family protein [Microlunatus kandeliicorticis]MBA8793235.1 hypothetical protein [Microlunatus kandeliicorticis]
MASLLSPRRSPSDRGPGRTDGGVRLTATLTQDDEVEQTELLAVPTVGWIVMALSGVLITALCGWVIVTGLTVLGWLSDAAAGLTSALGVGTQLWLLANGAGARLGGIGWTVTPLGLSLVVAFLLSRFAGLVARQYVAEHAGTTRRRAVGTVSAVVAAGYAVVVAATALALGAPGQVVRGFVGALLIAAVGALWGASRAVGFRLTERWPGWARPVPGAVAAAQLVLLATGAAALVASLLVHLDRVVRLTDDLHAGVAGGVAVLVGELAFAPTALIWSGSYALGAGFTLGPQTLVAPAATTLSLLPPFPLLGALPAEGGSPWQLLWLLGGAVAGGLAAWQVARHRPDARLDESTLVGGLSGVLAALVFTALAWLSSGDLGDVRLAGAGPRLLPLLIMSVTALGLSGMVCGFVLGLVRLVRTRLARRAEHPAG